MCICGSSLAQAAPRFCKEVLRRGAGGGRGVSDDTILVEVVKPLESRFEIEDVLEKSGLLLMDEFGWV